VINTQWVFMCLNILSINRSNNLSLFLNVINVLTIEKQLVWTQHHLDQHIDDDYEDVKRAFLAFFPDGAFMQF
jgi:hypothetical protein